MMRDKMTPYARYAAVFLTPNNGVTFQWRLEEGGPSYSFSENRPGGLSGPQKVMLQRTAGGSFVGKYYQSGVWYDINDTNTPPQGHLQPIPDMNDSVHVGLVVTSHNADLLCSASFDELGVLPLTAGEFPPWGYIGDVGLNAPEQLYVALKDGSARVSVVKKSDPNEVTISDDWKVWNIPLTDFNNPKPDFNDIDKVYIGLGDRDTPTEGGSGVLYIDAIRTCPPRCTPDEAKPVADIGGPGGAGDYDCVVDEADLGILAGAWLLRDSVITTVMPNAANLRARYEFENNFDDSSGNLAHATDPCGSGPGFAEGVIGGTFALSLDGVDDFLVVEPNAMGIDGNSPRTIACWAKANHTGMLDWSMIFGFTNTGGACDDHFNVGSLGGPGGVGAHVWCWEATMYSDQEALNWHHYVMTYDGATVRYYGDGVQMGTFDTNLISQDRVHIGKRHTHAATFAGKVDDARIYSYALSDAEVAYLATDGAASLHTPIPSEADLYTGELEGQQWINLSDYSILAGSWLEKTWWP